MVKVGVKEDLLQIDTLSVSYWSFNSSVALLYIDVYNNGLDHLDQSVGLEPGL